MSKTHARHSKIYKLTRLLKTKTFSYHKGSLIIAVVSTCFEADSLNSIECVEKMVYKLI